MWWGVWEGHRTKVMGKSSELPHSHDHKLIFRLIIESKSFKVWHIFSRSCPLLQGPRNNKKILIHLIYQHHHDATMEKLSGKQLDENCNCTHKRLSHTDRLQHPLIQGSPTFLALRTAARDGGSGGVCGWFSTNGASCTSVCACCLCKLSFLHLPTRPPLAWTGSQWAAVQYWATAGGGGWGALL